MKRKAHGAQEPECTGAYMRTPKTQFRWRLMHELRDAGTNTAQRSDSPAK